MGASSLHCIGGAPGAGAASAGPGKGKACGPDGLVDDGEDGNNQTKQAGGRGGYWYTYVDKAGSSVTPAAGAAGGTFAMTPGGANGSGYGANMKGKVGTGAVVYAGMGFTFIDPKGTYDASKYKGISFWAKKGPGSTGLVRLKVPDINTDEAGKVCTACFNDFGADLTLTDQWTKQTFLWGDLQQLMGWGSPHTSGVVPQKVYGVQWQVNQPGAAYDISVDQVEFLCE
jgi:endoglucanase